ncbi:sugar ABC transporter ATP-binding protein [Nocardioides zhouii]|uniref:Sugar ABC transporter ATP-binding protein n=1 Tax=Nocardioides zhouii TaxID=1168729 RepID=A0A4Q2SL57_9ACTN|nr:sugar ABC transporter ATP-binding protein [Nocardioides zhouii]RYC05913.1 sugar ABC transporter ATP-binding protein [Nocardioides zhouii]
MTEPHLLVDMQDITVSFGVVKALKGVSFDLRPGEVHALLGQNGAGKSTLIKVLSGVNERDGGSVLIHGRQTNFRSAQDSRDSGIAMVYQDLSLVPSMSVAANLFLGREPHGPLSFVRSKPLVEAAQAYLDEQGFPIRASAGVASLPFAYRQLTEIAKALMGDIKILVLDEPTSALSAGEEEILFNTVQEVTSRGVGVIYVTHRLQEVFRISDRVTVLRDGLNVGTHNTADITMEKLVSEIVGPGHERMAQATLSIDEGDRRMVISDEFAAAATRRTPVIELKGVQNGRLRGVDLQVRPGEILGLAGMIGSGRTEILETMFGLRQADQGEVLYLGKPVTWRSPRDAITAGVALVPEDRHLEGLVLGDTIAANTALPQLPHLTRAGMFNKGEATRRAKGAVGDLNVKAPGINTRLKNLSGGNQQKVVFGKWLVPEPKLLLLDEPTVGVDVGARDEIYGIIRRFAQKGCAVVVVSSDLVELELLCDTVTVVHDGRATTSVHISEVEGEERLHHLVQESAR